MSVLSQYSHRGCTLLKIEPFQMELLYLLFLYCSLISFMAITLQSSACKWNSFISCFSTASMPYLISWPSLCKVLLVCAKSLFSGRRKLDVDGGGSSPLCGGKFNYHQILTGDVLCGNEFKGVTHLGILQQWFGIHWWTCRAFALLIVALLIMLPLVMLRRVDSLKYSSALSILLALVFVVICSSMAFNALWFGKTQSLRILPDFSQVTALDLFTTVPVFVTGFGFHVNVHPIRAELVKPTDMIFAVRISLLICVAIYFAIGFFGYLLFGDSIMPDMLVNFDQNSDTSVGRLLDDIVRLSYALHLALVFPIMNYSLRANIDELFFSKKNKPPLALDTPRFVSLTLALLAFTYLVAVAIPNVWYFFQFLGSTTIVCLSFIFPAAIILRDMYGISTRKDQVMAVVVIVLAVGTSGIAIWTNFYGSSVDKP